MGVDDDGNDEVANRRRHGCTSCGHARSGPGDRIRLHTGGRETWIGTVTMQPNAKTGAHHHGRHEVAIYVVKGRSEIRWGERLEYAAEVGPGDFVYFAPYVPHQELNLDASGTVDFVVVRSDNERIVVNLDVVPVEEPETVY
jgi:uncharacterized RmlC-like cupin family protein